MAQPTVVLASSSLSRRLALDLLGLEYEIASPGIDEKAIRHDDPSELTRLLSEAKALAIGESRTDSCVVVAGDAVVALGSQILEKPADMAEAFSMLSAYSGRTVSFVTGLATYHTTTRQMYSTVAHSDLKFRTILETEVRAYMKSYPVLSFAGAFEGDAVFRFVERVEGSPNFRTAMPVSQLAVLLRKQGVTV